MSASVNGVGTMVGDCTCGYPFGSGACLRAHAERKAAMDPLAVDKPHEHRWLRPVGGVSWCSDPTCEATRRQEVDW